MATPPVIEISSVERVYHMGHGNTVRALRGIDLTICSGEFVAIVGPSGSGKSTLMYLLGCLDRPSSGSYRLCGEEIASLDDLALSRIRNRRIGYVFQSYNLLSEIDIVDNAALGLQYAGVSRPARREHAASIIERVGLGDRLDHTPRELSGGQMQRVAIARALATAPEIILADEPTGNLDQKTGAEIMATLRRLHASGRTIVLVTHDDKVARQADRVVRIVDGSIVADERMERSAESVPASEDSQVAAVQAPASGRISWSDLLRIAFREGIRAHRLRSFLTTLGIVFGVAAVVAMTAITEGGKRQQLDLIRQIGQSNITVSSLDLDGVRLLRQRRINPDGLTMQDFASIQAHITGIRHAAAWKIIRAEIRHGQNVDDAVRVLGITGAYPEVVGHRVGQGRFLDARDEERHARVCVMGRAVMESLGLDPASVLGAVVIVGDEPFTVVGVMAARDFGVSQVADAAVVDRNHDVYVPLSTAAAVFPKRLRESPLDAISLRMVDDDVLLPASAEIARLVEARHEGAQDHAVIVPLEALKQAQRTKEVFNVIIAVIAAISLVVGGIGIMNIMLATVTERTREIGVRRAIGASRRDISAQFLCESVLITAFGAALGLGLGVIGGFLVQLVFGFPVAFSVPISALAVGTALAVGVGFGLYPAWKAARMDPVEALRI